MKFLASAILIGFSSLFFAQEKKHILSGEHVLKGINPDIDGDLWTVVYQKYGKDKVIKASATPINYLPQFSGFKLDPTSEEFFYIAYQKEGNVSYVTDNQSLIQFLGRIDTGEEAAVVGILNGYFYDAEFKDLAGNYIDNNDRYTLEMGKITGTECPFQKTHYVIDISKATGNLIVKNDLGNYVKVYDKTCENNPHNDVIKEQMEEAKLKQQEKDLETKKLREAMKRKQRKQMRKD